MASFVFRSFPKIGKWSDALAEGNELFAEEFARAAQKQPVIADPMTGQPIRIPPPPVNRLFSAKIKLHGTNAGIQTDGKGNFACQSRSRLLSTQSKNSDNSGFCAWVEKNLSKGWDQITKPVVIFGEFVGPGILNGDACSKLPTQMLFVFAVLDVEEDVFVFLPEDIEKFVKPIVAANPGAQGIVHVIPEIEWPAGHVFSENFHFAVDPATANDKRPKPHPQVQADWQTKVQKLMQEIVMPMETQDPYIMSKFGVDGKGEGIVVFPNSWNGREYRHLTFKVKTPHHSEETPAEEVEKKKAAAKDPHVVFAKRFVAPARCEKVFAANNEHAPHDMNLFIDALVHDVRSETVAELQEQGGWSAAYEAQVRFVAAEWWSRQLKASARTKKDLANAAENAQADQLIQDNEVLLARIADEELHTTEPTVDAYATAVSERLVPDAANDSLRKKVWKRVKTWWLMRDKKTVAAA